MVFTDDSLLITAVIQGSVMPTFFRKKPFCIDEQMSEMNFEERIAVFTSINENYIHYASICFDTFRQYNPHLKFDFFVLCKENISARSKKILHERSIKLLPLDLDAVFAVESGWPYPSECFWLFKGPVIFKNLGYRYSLYVDADTQCIQKLNLSWLKSLDLIAGVPRGQTLYQFFKGIDKAYKLANEFEIDINFMKEMPAINSGVLFFNNTNYCTNEVYEKTVDLFLLSKEKGFPRKGDDSLLALYLSKFKPNYSCISPYWNNYFLYSFFNKVDIDKSYILHHHKVKPWVGSLGNLDKKLLKHIENWKKLDKTENYKIFWWRDKFYNFGDEITPWLFRKMFNKHIDKPCSLNESDNIILAVGSIMRLSSKNKYVWGSGIRNINQSDFTEAAKYLAVRGPFTRRQLINLGYSCPEVYGDPGLLLPRYYNPASEKKYRLGIIPHIVDYYDLMNLYGHQKDVFVINLRTNNIEEVVDRILECECTVSSSLHGIVTSVAYDIPTRWLKYSGRVTGDDIKYYDFFASIDQNVYNSFDYEHMKSPIEQYNPFTVTDSTTVEDLISKTKRFSKASFDPQKLIDSFTLFD